MRVLSQRALNRATLARQLLLERVHRPAAEVIEHLVGLQAQTPHTWYTGLWNRIVDFDPIRVGALLADRELVRIALMRSTIHVVTARDCLAIRPVVQIVSERSINNAFGRNLVGIDTGALVAAGRALVEHEPLTFSQLGKLLAERFPGRDPASLAQAIRARVPLVQVPPRGVWGASGLAKHTPAEHWLGKPLSIDVAPDSLVLRFLGAFGPATVKDIQYWSGLTRLGEVVDRLRSRLITFTDEAGRELLDLPEAPRPDPDTPAPVRFLYDYDNLLLSHADRSRFITDRYHLQDFDPDGPMPSVILLDGVTGGLWRKTVHRGVATLVIRPLARLPKRHREAIEAEGARLLAFAGAGAKTHDITFLPPEPGSGAL